MQHRFTLQKYAGATTRYTCPSCGSKKQFTRYIDTHTGAALGNHVGICNRVNNCGYHYTPKDFFRDNPHKKKDYADNNGNFTNGTYVRKATTKSSTTPHPPITLKEDPPLRIDIAIMERSREKPFENNFFLYLYKKFGLETSEWLYNEYCFGSCMHRGKNATIFWQVDQNNQVRAGKVICYDKHSGKRNKETHATWVHSIHPTYRRKKWKLEQCLFGEHLLNEYPNKIIGIVESEKTAIITAGYVPEYLWLATGSLHEFKWQKLHILGNRRAIAFPDLGGYDLWRQKVLTMDLNITVSDVLEKIADDAERKEGLDVGDYFGTSPTQQPFH